MVWFLTKPEWNLGDLNEYERRLQIGENIDELNEIKDKVKTLKLPSKDFVNENLPLSITTLTNLEYLYLNCNLLTILPETFGQLTNLKHLDLNSNLLTTLPASFEKLVNLEYLDLKNNALTTLPAFFEKLANLKHLDLKNNSFIHPIRDDIFPNLLHTSKDELIEINKNILDINYGKKPKGGKKTKMIKKMRKRSTKKMRKI